MSLPCRKVDGRLTVRKGCVSPFVSDPPPYLHRRSPGLDPDFPAATRTYPFQGWPSPTRFGPSYLKWDLTPHPQGDSRTSWVRSPPRSKVGPVRLRFGASGGVRSPATTPDFHVTETTLGTTSLGVSRGRSAGNCSFRVTCPSRPYLSSSVPETYETVTTTPRIRLGRGRRSGRRGKRSESYPCFSGRDGRSGRRAGVHRVRGTSGNSTDVAPGVLGVPCLRTVQQPTPSVHRRTSLRRGWVVDPCLPHWVVLRTTDQSDPTPPRPDGSGSEGRRGCSGAYFFLLTISCNSGLPSSRPPKFLSSVRPFPKTLGTRDG